MRLIGKTDGPIYQGADEIVPCATCKSGKAADGHPNVKRIEATNALQAELYARVRAMGLEPLRLYDNPPKAASAANPVAVTRPAVPPVLVAPLYDDPPINIEIHTLRFGAADWLLECAATLDDWCARNSLPLRCWGDPSPKYPAPKFCEVDMLRDFLAGENDWMMYIDADVFMHPLSPRPFFAESGFYIRRDQPSGAVRSYQKWLTQYYGASAGEWIYRNAGVWACDRKSAEIFLSVVSEPYYEGWQEQHAWNYWLSLAEVMGLEVCDLPGVWNRWPKEEEPGWAWHLAGHKKMQKLADIRGRRYLPRKPEPFPVLTR